MQELVVIGICNPTVHPILPHLLSMKVIKISFKIYEAQLLCCVSILLLVVLFCCTIGIALRHIDVCNVGAVVEKWFEEDKAIPLKKRRGSFERRWSEEECGTKSKIKCKTNKKCSVGIEEGDDGTKGGGKKTKPKKKKKVRGSVIMEGSRCSRVNGRGWRCSEPTLVGYSLCEHHLGKGRLRSMSSVRNRSTTASAAAAAAVDVAVEDDEVDRVQRRSSTLPAQEENGDGDGYGRKTVVRRRGKLGMVKARSISSLLRQAAAGDDNNATINGSRADD